MEQRVIKFRAWNGNVMLSPVTLGKAKNDDILDYNFGAGNGLAVMQFTGLTDKNGKEIYERDRVRTPAGIGIVEYIDGCWYIQWNADDKTTLHDTPLEMREVIGNVYEG